MANTRFTWGVCVCIGVCVCVLKLSQRTAERSVFQWGNRWNRAGQQCDGWEVKDTPVKASSGLCDKQRGLDFFFFFPGLDPFVFKALCPPLSQAVELYGNANSKVVLLALQ